MDSIGTLPNDKLAEEGIAAMSQPPHTAPESPQGGDDLPRPHPIAPDLQLLRREHAPALLAFERENRAYFAASIPDRGDAFFVDFDEHVRQWLESQAAGSDFYHLLVTGDGAVVGRVNLYGVADGEAELGYRIAQRVTGQGLATAAVRQVRELAVSAYGLSRLRARVTQNNLASRKVLAKNGFLAVDAITLNGKEAIAYLCELR